MSNTDKLTVLAEAIISRLQSNYTLIKSVTPNADGITYPTVASASDIVYGDQDKIPRVPFVCVEPGSKNRTLQANQYVMLNDMTVFVLVYHAGPEVERARKQSDEIGEAVESILHGDPQMGGTVVYGFCPVFESGYTYRNGTYYRSIRMTYSATTKMRPS